MHPIPRLRPLFTLILLASLWSPLALLLPDSLGTCVRAQFDRPYLPTTLEGTTWVLFDNSGTGSLEGDHRVLTIRGDSTVNDTVYKKLIYQQFFPRRAWGDITPPYEVGRPQLLALLREDSLARRVYGRVPRFGWVGEELSGDQLLNDYGLYYEESYAGPFGETVDIDRVDSVDLFGERRLRQGLLNSRHSGTAIEGIGSELNGPLTYLNEIVGNMGWHALIDYCSGADCTLDFTSSLRERATVPLEAFPNPTEGTIYLPRAEGFGPGPLAVRLVDARGRTVSAWVFGEGRERLELGVGELPAGVYLLMVRGNGVMGTQRVVRR